MLVELDEQKFADISAKTLMKFMSAAKEETEREFYLLCGLCGLHVLTLFGEMLFGEEGDNADGSKE